MRIAAAILVVGGIFLLISWAPAEAQQAEQQRDDTAGAVWRLVRGGGGLVSPWGTTGVSLQSVTSSGERFVAVGEWGLIAHSSDGNRWVEASFSATDEWLTDVAWGDGRFVALGGDEIIHSNDGERWVRSRSSDMGRLESVAWGNGRYVAVGGGGTIARSSDGDRWQRVRNAATRADLSGIAWGGGRFVAVGSGGTIVHSDDGDGWKMASDTGTSATLYGVAWNGERFVAVGEGTILHSSDGNLWAAAARNPARSSDWLRDVVWSGERFVAVGGYTILLSSDGDRWQRAPQHAGWGLNSVAWSRAGLVAVGEGGAILRSSDGFRWEPATAAGTGQPLPALDGVAWGGGRFVALAHWPDSILHSRDGEVWREASFREDVYGLCDVVWGGERFVAVGYTIGYSADGDHWQRAHTSEEGGLHAIAWSGERYVAVGHAGLILHSSDGERWSRASDSATRETLDDVAWNGERFVAVGFHGAIVHSSDGDRWKLASRPAVPFRKARPEDDPNAVYYFFSGIAWNGERFVAVGWGGGEVGTVAHSSDGDRWELATDHDYLGYEHFEAVAWNGERFVAVSYFDGTIMHSTDGDRWERARETATFDLLHDVAWGNGRFVAVGWNGTIVISP